jgi:hypothetical protein
MAAMFVEGMRRAWLGEACGGDAWAGEWQRFRDSVLDTPPEPGGHGYGRAEGRSKTRVEYRQIKFTSRGASVCLWRGRAIAKKIIGHAVSIFRESVHGGGVFVRLLRTLALLHQPAGQHGGGVFLDPKIKKSADLLAEIGGVAEAREFVALERVSRCGEQELPRRLGFVMVHAGLLGSDARTLTLN